MFQPMTSSTAANQRHEKLYVLAQCVGWGGFTLIYGGLALFIKGMSLAQSCVFIATNICGLLLSHVYRIWIHRRGWKQLSWPALLPRAIIAMLVLAALWTAVSWPLDLLIEGTEPKKLSLFAIILFSILNGVWIYAIWSLLYFGYNIADRYRRSEVERAQLAATVKESELRALKSQVNPHFIFNALNSLRALIDEDPARARLAVTQLANLLRYSLQSGQLETVPFEEELRIVNDYLALEQVRHEERLRLRLDVAPETLQLPVPPMLLQTLVENAVKYGISTRAEGGEIAITSRRTNDALRIQVINPGVLPDTTVASVSARLNGSTGVGLRNAAERLRLLFGERAGLQLRAGGTDTVIAEAFIPVMPAKHPPVP